MKTVGIICEYNPLHLGHRKQIHRIRQEFGPDCAIVCAMSGNYVQRGSPAIIDKSVRAQAAVCCGADLVLELPVTTALSSAEGFAAGGVKLLSPLCDCLCFGAETANRDTLMAAAGALLSDVFPPLLRQELDTGKSFPAAREAALMRLGADSAVLSQPNNILAVEYCKAILSQSSAMEPFPIHRQGSYHALSVDADNPSATAVRNLMLISHNWRSCVPADARPVLESASLHSTAAGEKAVLSRLRTMTDAEFEALPYGNEGLWRKLMHAARREATLEEILASTKSKRYTRTRLDRMVMCAFLGITAETMQMDIPYTRVLAFTDRGRQLLKEAKKAGVYLNAGESSDHPYWALEKRCGDLYGLFCVDGIEPPGREESRRIYYQMTGAGTET